MSAKKQPVSVAVPSPARLSAPAEREVKFVFMKDTFEAAPDTSTEEDVHSQRAA